MPGRTVAVVFLGALASLALLAQAPADPSSQTATVTEKPASIEGVVNHGTTGAPLAHVHVTLRGVTNGTQRQYGAMTAPDGRFSITGIVPGSYSAATERVGYVMPAGPASRNQVRLQADEKKSDFELKMTPTGQITGRVTDSEGAPVEGASINPEGGNGGYGGTTDEKGQFRIGGLAPGKYRVRASVNNMMWSPEIRTDGTVDVHNAGTYYPGVLTSKEATRVEVRPDGDTSGVDIQLKRVPWVRVSGKVAGKSRASDSAFVMVQKDSQLGGQPGVSVKQDGTFTLWRLDPGRYWISAFWNAPGGQNIRTAPVEVEVAGSNIDNLELRFIPNFDVSGQLQYENDQAKQLPQPPARANATQNAQAQNPQNAPSIQRNITLREAATGMMQVNSAKVSDDDTFHFEKVPPGRYRVALSWNTAYVKSIQLGPTVIDGPVVDLSNGPGGAGLSLMLGAASGSISGTVQDDSGTVQGTRVALTLEDPDARAGFNTRYSIAKADGSYAFPNLAPGRYKVVAVSENDTDLVMQRFGLEEYEDLMETIEVHTDEKVSKDLKRRSMGNR